MRGIQRRSVPNCPPARRLGGTRGRTVQGCASRTSGRDAQVGVSRIGIRLMPLKKFDCRRSGWPVELELGDPLDHLLEDDLDLEAGEVGAGAEVRARRGRRSSAGSGRGRRRTSRGRRRRSSSKLPEMYQVATLSFRRSRLPPNSMSAVAVRRKWCTGRRPAQDLVRRPVGISVGLVAQPLRADRGSRSARARPGRSSGGWSRCRRPRAAGSRRRTRARSAGSRRSRPRPAW